MPNPSEERPVPRPGSAEEALRRLEQRLDRASEAAERLMAEAAEAAVGGAAGGAAGGATAGGSSASGSSTSGSSSSGSSAGGSAASGSAAGGSSASGSSASGSSASGSSPGDPPPGDPAEPPKPPPAGWQIPEDARAGTAELDPLVALVQALRDLVPPELQRRLVAAIRELLLALRALIDWYLERLERRREQAVEVQDIPII
jgi:hypothetical protein